MLWDQARTSVAGLEDKIEGFCGEWMLKKNSRILVLHQEIENANRFP